VRNFLRRSGVELNFANRCIDTNSIGIATFGTYNSDDLFEAAGFGERDPKKHNALDDAKMALGVVRMVKMLWGRFVEEA